MSYVETRLNPGLDIESTPTDNAAGYNETANGRFRKGLFEKLGGFTKYFPFGVGGEGKALHAWQDLNDIQHLAVATTTEVDVITNGVLQNITPQELLTNPNEDFGTTAGSATVLIQDPGVSNVTTDDSVEFLTPISVGGIILSGTYRIAHHLGGDQYTIPARQLATATVANAGAVPVFDTLINSPLITVTLAAHAQMIGSTVVLPVATTVGGLVIQGKYEVKSIVSATQFTITAATAATATATGSMNGGNAAFRYSISLGPSGAGLGYGLGGDGLGPYGLGGGAGAGPTEQKS